MNAQEKMGKVIIGTVRAVMRGRNFDVDIQPVGTNKLETIMGKSDKGTFKIVYDHSKIYVKVNDQEMTFDNQWDESFITLNSTIKHQCYGYRNNHYYRDDKGNWIKMPAKTGLFARIFGKRAK